MNFYIHSKSCCRWIHHVCIASSYFFFIHYWMVDSIMGDGGPTFIKAPTNQSTFVDRNLSIFCEVRGEPLPVVTWQQRNLTTLRWEDLPKFGTQNRFFYHSNPRPTLQFERMLRSDSGFYRCVAHNRKGTVFSDAFYINVEAKVTFVRPPRGRTVLWGTEVVLQCEVISFPLPHRTWTKNNVPIYDAVSHMIYSQPTLKINATETASYSCLAENTHSEGYSNVSATAIVNVIDGQCQTYTGNVCKEFRDLTSVSIPVSIPQPLQYIESSIQALLHLLDPSPSSERPAEATSLNASTLEVAASQLGEIPEDDKMKSTNSRCREVAVQLLCAVMLPECQKTSGVSAPLNKPLCRESCMVVRDVFCLYEWRQVVSNQDKLKSETQTTLYHMLPDCDSLPLGEPEAQCTYINFITSPSQQVTSNESNATASEQTEPDHLGVVEDSLFSTLIVFLIIFVLAIFLTVIIIATVYCIQFMMTKSGSGCHGNRQYGAQAGSDSAAAAMSLVTGNDDINIDVRRLPSNRSYRRRRESAASQPSNRVSGSHEIEPTSLPLDRLEFQRNEIEWMDDIAQGMYGRVFLASIPTQTVAHLSPAPLGRGSLGGVGGGRCSRLTGATHTLGSSVQTKTLFGGFGGAIAGARTKTVVKMLEEEEEVAERFKSELEIVASLSHENIIRLLGVCLRGTPLCALYEYMDSGDLSGYLIARRPGHFIPRHRNGSPGSNTPANISELVRLLGIGRQISAAMVYVSSQHIVHRDIATRNCLVSRESSCTIPLSDNPSVYSLLGQHLPLVKLSDFGLATRLNPPEDIQRKSVTSVDVDYVEGFEGEPIPVRWLSPESIAANRYSAASDVWSYGITLWEIFSYAAQPYPDLGPDSRPEEVAAVILNGYIMERPDAASVEAYDIMSHCWTYDPLCRPTFEQIYRRLCSLEVTELNRCYRS